MMRFDRTALVQQVVKAVEAMEPNEALFLHGEAIAARSAAGMLRFGRGWFCPRWYRGDGLTMVREHVEMMLTGNPYDVARARREFSIPANLIPAPCQNVGRRNFYVVRNDRTQRPSLVDPSPHLNDSLSHALREAQGV